MSAQFFYDFSKTSALLFMSLKSIFCSDSPEVAKTSLWQTGNIDLRSESCLAQKNHFALVHLRRY